MARRLLVCLVALGWLVVAGSPAAEAASPAVTRIFVKPNSGYTTSAVQVKGTYATIGLCHAPPLLFTFTFDSRYIWSRAVSYCAPQSYIWDTGLSPYIWPASQAVGMHTVMVSVSYAGRPVAGGTATWAYRIYQAPASPAPAKSPAAPPSPASSPAASPVPLCTAAAPQPSGTGFAPLLGLALFGAASILVRRRRLLVILGLALVATSMLGCSAASGQRATTVPTPSPICVQT